MSANYFYTLQFYGSRQQELGVSRWGFTGKHFVTFCIYPWDPGAVEEERRPEGAASMREGDVEIAVDGTVVHNIWVTSSSTNRFSVYVDLYELIETVPNPVFNSP
ncbi:hypothetical protein B0G84_5719 [Paraburkholderia sp. BL8N3]|nr:hypothetical protein [Paraburkholderia sp. BL8N3]TCK36706.1 hypothetical protein B0G84_5719 [Paraburkholderia sp. BL8N3]